MIYGNKIHEKIANFDHDINTFSGILNLRQQYENVQAVGKLKPNCKWIQIQYLTPPLITQKL